MQYFWICLLINLCLISEMKVNAQTTISPNIQNNTCSAFNASCEECLKNVSCMYCTKTSKCLVYPYKEILPSSELCSLSSLRWGVCWVNFEALIISMSVIGGVLLIGIILCCCKCCGCCCFSRTSAKYEREAQRIERERQERSIRQNERKKDRQQRNDDIRRKYGLMGSNETQYQKFENEA